MILHSPASDPNSCCRGYHQQREALVRQFVNERFVSRGMIADVAIHGHSPSGDERNHHAHILLTTRTLIRMRKARDARVAKARERDRERGRDDGLER